MVSEIIIICLMGSIVNLSSSRVIGSKSLPYDAEIEYLESTGTQWIDTKVRYNTNNRLLLEYDYTSKTSGFGNSMIFGCDDTPRISFNLFYAPKLFIRIENIIKTVSPTSHTIIVENKMIYSYTNTGYELLEDVSSISSFETPVSIYLFAWNSHNKMQFPTIIRIKRFLIDNTCDLIPVRVGTTGYMYDKVSGQLFGNAGTGNFILGPDK